MNNFNLSASRKIGSIIVLLAALNTVLTGLGLWQTLWVFGLAVNFGLIVLLADEFGRVVPISSRKTYERGLAICFPLLLLLAWELVVFAGLLNPRWFPPPSKTLRALWQMSGSYDTFTKTSLLGRPWLISSVFARDGWPGIWGLLRESHVLLTLFRVFAGFFGGTIPGVVLGVFMGMNRTIRMMLDATLSAIYVLPKIAIFPLMMIVFANPFGEGPKIAVVAIAAFFLVVINTMTGVRDIDPVYLESGRNYGARRWQLFRHVIIPGALPVIFAGLRLALGTAIITTVAIEFVRAKQGAGYLILYYWEIMATEKMYAALVVVMILGVVLSYGLQWLERRIMPWKKEHQKTKRT